MGGGSRCSRLGAGRLGGAQVPVSELDPLLFWSAAGLLLFGLVMVYSSSIAFAEGTRIGAHQATFFLVRHSVFLAIGLVAGGHGFFKCRSALGSKSLLICSLEASWR